MSFLKAFGDGFRNFSKFLLARPVNWMAARFTSFPRQDKVDASLTELYNEIIKGNEKKGRLIEFKPLEHPVIIFTDQHKGARNGSDDFRLAEDNFLHALNYYDQRDYYYINLGDSDVSFGLPDRHTVNQTFLALAARAGASCVITNPEKLTATIRAADLLLGRDVYAGRYIANYRKMVKLGLIADAASGKS